MPSARRSFAAALVASVVVVSACSSADGPADSEASEQDGLEVIVSFYPLEFLTRRIVGDLSTVDTLTSRGVDPHDAELTPRGVASVQQADLVIYSSGLQAAVDDAVAGQARDHSFNVNLAANLMEAREDAHSDEDHTDEGDDHGDTDPHFWLDPGRMADVSVAIVNELTQLDPDHAETYRHNATQLIGELFTLQDEYDTGLADCSVSDMITTHAAFGYIAAPYGWDQVSVTGLTPDAEPSPARLAEVSAIVEESQATTIYSEVLLGADIANTIARETGAEVAVLDPIEGLTDDSPGTDYLQIMRANLEILRAGQGCT